MNTSSTSSASSASSRPASTGFAQGGRMAACIKAIPLIGKYLEPKDKIAVLRLSGVIADSAMMRRAGISFKKFDKAMKESFEISRLKAVALVINSPGGSAAQSALIATRIRKLAQEKEVPVYTFVEDVAASGGYWLACAGDEIYAQETSIVGSIGVISASFGLEDFIARHNIHRRLHSSGRDKSFLDPFKPEKADDVMRLKILQENIHQSFKEWVQERRATRLKGSESDLMEGAFWTGRDALERGLIDGLGDMHQVMADKYGSAVKFVDVSPEKKGLLSALLPFGDSEAALATGGLDIGAVVELAEERAAWGRFGL